MSLEQAKIERGFKMTYTRKEILNRIEELETRKFYLDMTDRSTLEDYEYNRELCAEILSWKGLLK